MDEFLFSDQKPSKTARQKRRDKRIHEEVIETGRFRNARNAKNHRKQLDSGRKKTLQKETMLDSLPMQRGIRAGGRPWLRDNLQPLERWLSAQVGRPWADVYADLGKIANPNSMHGAHIREHLWQYVAKNSWLDDDGQMVIADQFGRLKEGFSGRAIFFVDPKTGLFSAHGEAEIKGPFPKKARFKKEKDSLKSKLRQNATEKKPAEKPGIDTQNWPAIRTRLKWAAPGDQLDILEKGNIFRVLVEKTDVLTGQKHHRINGCWVRGGEKIRMLTVKILIVFSGDKYGLGQQFQFSDFPRDQSGWEAFDAGRLFKLGH